MTKSSQCMVVTRLVSLKRPQTIPPLPNTFVPDIWLIIFERFYPPDALEPFDFERNWPQDERWWHQQLVEADLAMENLARVSRGFWQISFKYLRDHGILLRKEKTEGRLGHLVRATLDTWLERQRWLSDPRRREAINVARMRHQNLVELEK